MIEHPNVTAVRAFNEKHGEFYSSGTQAYYADGSMREKAPFGVMYDATKADLSQSDQEWQVYTNIVVFFRLKLAQAVKAWDELNLMLSHTVPPDPKAELAKLKRLRITVAERKQELAVAEAALANTQQGRYRKSVAEANQERKQQFAEFQQQRRAIRI